MRAATGSQASTSFAILRPVADRCRVAGAFTPPSTSREYRRSLARDNIHRSAVSASSTTPAAADTAPVANTTTSLVTFQEAADIAKSRGLSLYLRTLGPVYRVVCRDGSGEAGRILAVTTGFVAPPLGIMHCDTLQVFTAGMKGEEGSRARVGVMGLGLLIGGATFAYGLEAGCTKAEILAINDDGVWRHR
jgi:hypothetical protein